MKENKATGLDGVSAKLLRLAAPVLTKTVTHILNQSILTGHFPTSWKLGKVTPIHKSGNRSDRNNFRPITILCTLSKLLEKHVHDGFYKFLLDRCLLYINQSGFRAFHSCETALTRLVDMWTTNMEKGLLNGVVLLDLRKAFDLVNINVLLDKLKIYQCDEKTQDWFRSYLQGRTQCVQFKGKISDTMPITHGVPQGSILGPLLFILFMNDLPLHVDSSTDMYADDSTLCETGETVDELNVKLNDDMVCVNKGCHDNQMAANGDKTKVMLVTTYQKEAKLPKKELTVYYDNKPLKSVDSEKLLGVKIDKHLTWKEHVNQTANKISRNIALLRRIKAYLPHQTRITFYKAYIQPHIDYCNTVWGQSTHVPRIHILQKMALRIIMDVPKLTHTAPLFDQCGVMPIQSRVKFRTVIMVFKTLKGLNPSYMSDMFKSVSDVSSRITRSSQSKNLYVPRKKLCVSRRSLRYSGAVLYNALGSTIQDCQSLASFKYKAFKHFM